MFKVDGHIILDVQNQVDYRDIKYGRDDLGDLAKKFVWTEPLDSLMEVCKKTIDEFIYDYKLDDENSVPEEEREFLFLLNYPSAEELLEKYPEYFCKLLFEAQDLLINRPYFDIPYFEKKRSQIFHGFAINKIYKIWIEDNVLNMEGVGYFFPRINK